MPHSLLPEVGVPSACYFRTPESWKPSCGSSHESKAFCFLSSPFPPGSGGLLYPRQFPYHRVPPTVSSPRGWNQGYSEPCQLLEFPLRGRGELGALPSSWAVVKAEGSPSSSMTEQLRLGSHMVPTSAIPNVSQVVAPHRSCQSQREGVSPGDSTDAAVPLSHLIPGVPHTGSY